MRRSTKKRRPPAKASRRRGTQPPRALLGWVSRSTLVPGLGGAVLLWAALPRIDLWPLAWVAPVAWVGLIRRQDLPGKRPYRALWLAGFLFWLAEMHWLRYPHWTTWLGWVAVACYLGCYLPLVVGLGRVAVHRLRLPVVLAAPIVWTGLELARGHLLGGFTMAGLDQTQYRWIALIQISDLGGAYAVGFLVMLVAACLGRMLPCDGRPGVLWPLVPAAAVLAAALVYGHLRLDHAAPQPKLRVALIQGSVDIDLKPDPDRRERLHAEHLELSRRAVREYGQVDLVVWPETVFGPTLWTYDAHPAVPHDWDRGEAEFRRSLQWAERNSREAIRRTAEQLHAALLVGITREHFGPAAEEVFNTALFADASGKIEGYYDKMDLVIFGEYFPLADRLHWLYDFTPVNTLGLGLKAGDRPVAFSLKGLRLSPNICYESVVPQVIRRQVVELARQGREPDVLVNLTNDGWFRGSNELDMHLICGVFRAVECRKPFLIAANTGFSAWIDADGRIRARGPRRAPGTLLAEVSPSHRTSLYMKYGDLPAGICLAACLLLAAVGLVERWRPSTFRRVGALHPRAVPT